MNKLLYQELINRIARQIVDGQNNDELLRLSQEAVERNRLNLIANYGLAEGFRRKEMWLEAYKAFHTFSILQNRAEDKIIDQEHIDKLMNDCMNKAVGAAHDLDYEEQQRVKHEIIEINNIDKILNKCMFLIYDREIPEWFGKHEYFGKKYHFGRYNDWFGSYFYPDQGKNAFKTITEIYEISEEAEVYEVDQHVTGYPCLMPVLSEGEVGYDVSLTFEFDSGMKKTVPVCLKKNSFQYLRIDSPVRLTSSENLIYANPVPLVHDNNRKRLVLNIFLDSFNWCIFRNKKLGEIMPYTAAFFEKGAICENYYAGSEYTYPSVASYWTGLRQIRHQGIDGRVFFPIPERFPLISEIFKKAGYFTAKIGGNDSVLPQYGYIRGIDRFLYHEAQQKFHAQEVVSETINHMRTFEGADQFIWMEIQDLHEVAGGFLMPMTVQSKLPPEVNIVDNDHIATIYQTYSPHKKAIFEEALRNIDFYLRYIYEYIEENFTDGDVVVTLMSDHGNGPNVDAGEPFISMQRINVPLMVRAEGAQIGICEEKIETIDYGHILCKLAGIKTTKLDDNDGMLPVYFGGENEKQYVFAQSLHPHRKYCATIITDSYCCYIESDTLVADDGSVDLRKYSAYMVDPMGHRIKDDEDEINKCLMIVREKLGDYLLYG